MLNKRRITNGKANGQAAGSKTVSDTEAAVTLTINGHPVQVEAGATILDAARKAGIAIPTLCDWPGVKARGACRMCVVEIEGARGALVPSCSHPAGDGMRVRTNTARVRRARETVLKLIFGHHPPDCLHCVRNSDCELLAVADTVRTSRDTFENLCTGAALDTSSPALLRDPDKCILCGRCVAVCSEVQGIGAITFAGRGIDTAVKAPFDLPLWDSECVACGQCSKACPTGALTEKDETDKVWDAITDDTKHVVVQMAPAVRVTASAEFGLEPGPETTGKLVAALRRFGFDAVFDTTFTADLTIMEEASELLRRAGGDGHPLPLFTSCCPGWITFIEKNYPDRLSNLSSCKSPQQMMGSIIKSVYARKVGIDPKDVVVVSIMPCTAKKAEAARPEFEKDGVRDVDIVLTTREFIRLLDQGAIRPDALEPEAFDDPFGESTGAGVLFGSTGGVAEAALRTAYWMVTGRNYPEIVVSEVRGTEGVRTLTVDLDGTKAKCAVVHGLKNIRAFLDSPDLDEYAFVEFMACPGGCIGGGGQPHGYTPEQELERIKSLQALDDGAPLRHSHDNPSVKRLYEEYLDQPGSEEAEHLLHTTYAQKPLMRLADGKEVLVNR